MEKNKEKEMQDFFKQEKIKMELKASQKKAKVTKFLKAGATAILSVSILMGLGVAGYDAYEKQRDSTIKNNQEIFLLSSANIFDKLKKYSNSNTKLYSESKTIIESLEKESIIVQALTTLNLKQIKYENDIKFVESQKSIDSTKSIVKNLLLATSENATKEDKINAFYSNNDNFNRFQHWEDNVASPHNKLNSINQNLKAQSNFLVEAKDEIMSNIKKHIDNKDINIDKAKERYQAQVKAELALHKKEIDDVNELQKKEAKIAKDEFEAYDPEISEKELVELNQSIDELGNIASSQIDKDEAIVKQTLDQVTSNNPTSSQQVNNSNFMNYFLLYHWLTTSNSTNNAAVQASGAATSLRNTSNNLYSMNTPNSHFNKNMAIHNPANFAKLQAVQQNIAKTQTRVSSFKSARISGIRGTSISRGGGSFGG